eukprot:Ihof_evm5s64 gene=Ihof_evmTU5s64
MALFALLSMSFAAVNAASVPMLLSSEKSEMVMICPYVKDSQCTDVGIYLTGKPVVCQTVRLGDCKYGNEFYNRYFFKVVYDASTDSLDFHRYWDSLCKSENLAFKSTGKIRVSDDPGMTGACLGPVGKLFGIRQYVRVTLGAAAQVPPVRPT